MNCSIFHNKIYDLIEEDCSIDFKNSMEEHRNNCKSCKNYYEKELEISKGFKEFFNVKDIEFKSSRVGIMNAINKNQYKNNYVAEIYTHFNRYKKKYITWAAVFAIIFVGATKLLEVDKINFALKGFSNTKSSSSPSQSVKNPTSFDKSQESAGTTGKQNTVKALNNITFEKLELQGDQKIIPSDIWKESGDGKYSACLAKNATNTDSEISKVYLKDNNTGKLWSFTINNDLNVQNTPIFLAWSQKEGALMVTIGKATGTIVEGGDVYVLNLNSGIAKLIEK